MDGGELTEASGLVSCWDAGTMYRKRGRSGAHRKTQGDGGGERLFTADGAVTNNNNNNTLDSFGDIWVFELVGGVCRTVIFSIKHHESKT